MPQEGCTHFNYRYYSQSQFQCTLDKQIIKLPQFIFSNGKESSKLIITSSNINDNGTAYQESALTSERNIIVQTKQNSNQAFFYYYQMQNIVLLLICATLVY